MPFEVFLEKYKSRQPSTISVRFSYTNDDSKRIDQGRIQLDSLYKDWYGDCEHCPSNDTVISAVEIHASTEEAFLLNTVDIRFGDFMDALEANFDF